MMPATNQGVGENVGFPDVCNTPIPVGTAPIPYPNMGTNAAAMPFAPNVFISLMPGHNQSAKPLMTNGDNAGVAHPTVMMPGGCTMGNPLVNINGLPSEHLLTPSNGNNMNNPVGAKLVPSVVNVFMCSLGAAAVAPAASRSEALLADLWGLPDHSLGATLRPPSTGAGLVVVHVRRDELADRAGLRAGDRLLAVDGRAVSPELDPAPLAPGAKVVLEVDRLGWAAPREFVVRQQSDRPPAAEARLLCDGVGCVVVRRCGLDLPAALRASIESLRTEGARALLLDLRGNPGGTLGAVERAAGMFLPEGSPVGELRLGDTRHALRSRGDAIWEHELVVLVDGQTASAAEVLAACLQDCGRARVVGRVSFGKGRGEFADRAESGEVYRPAGEPLQGRGVVPQLVAKEGHALAQALALVTTRAGARPQ